MRLAAYCRVSTDHRDQLNSLENQKSFFTEYAALHGHQLTRLYADEGITGTSLKRRTEFRHLMADAARGEFDMVVAKDISRFARNTVDFLQSIRQLKAMGIHTAFLTANMTTLGDSEFVLTIFGAMAQEESANLSKRVKFGKRINAQRGRVPGCIYGYDRVDNFTLTPNEGEAETVREIFRLYTEEGLGCRSVAQVLNNRAISTKFGHQWDPTGIRRILTNSIYCGRYVNHKYEVADYLTGRSVPVPPEERLHHERLEWAIVPEETFQAAQVQLTARRRQYDSGGTFRSGRYSSRHTFSTLIRCSLCGGSFGRKTYGNTRVYWVCRAHGQGACPNAAAVEEKELRNAIRDYLAAKIADRGQFIASAAGEAIRTADPARSRKRNGKRALESRRKRIQELYISGLIGMEELRDRTEKLDAALADMEEDGADHPDPQMYAEAVEAFLAMETFTNAEMRRLIDRAEVDEGGRVTVCLRKIADAPSL